MSWDDGKHTKVKRVQLTFDAVINSIEVEYEGTSLKSQRRGTVGSKSNEFTLSPDEYITEVNGYSKTAFAGEVITALTFKTNKKTYGTYGVKTGFYFSLNAPKDKQIAGFLGSSTNALNSIDGHFAPIPPPGNTGTNPSTGDTGGNNDGTKPGTGNTGSKPGGTGGNNDGTKPGTGDTGSKPGGNNDGTKPGTGDTGSKPGGTGGNNDGTKPGTGDTGSKPGGTGGNNDGAKPGTGDTGSNTDSSPQKVEAQGGKGGNQWDDGADHDGVIKIHVTVGLGIEQIRFDYVKSGQPKEGTFHGLKGNRSFTYTIDVNHPDEYLISVKGGYDSSNIIQGIEFKTNTKTSEYFGYNDGTQFSLEVKDKKIIGFHGLSDTHLNSLGAYFVPISTSSSSSSVTPIPPPPYKSEVQGGNYGETFDDGAFDHVKKIYIGQGHSCVAYVKFDYEKGGKKETREYGKMTLLSTEEFEVDSDDYITSMDVYIDKIYGYESDVVTAVAFKTFKGKISHPFGITTERKYEIKDVKGGKLAGFHGKASDVLYAIGAYFAPTTN